MPKGLLFARERKHSDRRRRPQGLPEPRDFDAELARVIDGHAPTLVVLAGFMRILTAGFVARRYLGRMVNIHPRCCRPSWACTRTSARSNWAASSLA